MVDGGNVGPNPGEYRVVAGNGREGRVYTGVVIRNKNGKEPFDIGDGRLQKTRHFPDIRSGGDSKDLTEDAASLLTLANKRLGSFKIQGEIGEDGAERAVVKCGGGGGNESSGGTEEVGELGGECSEVGTVEL